MNTTTNDDKASIQADTFFSKNVFEEEGYMAHYVNLAGIVKRHLNLDNLRGRRIVDLGCGYGGYGRQFLDLGAEVVFVDGRAEKSEAVERLVPKARTFQMNVETDRFPSEIGDVDVVLCMGLIYHTRDPKVVFEKIRTASERMFIETNCLDHDGVQIVWLQESTEPNQFSVTGDACRPSPKWVLKTVSESGFPFVSDISHKDGNKPPRPGFPGHLYDWDFQRTCGWRRNECSLRRMFMASAREQDELMVW